MKHIVCLGYAKCGTTMLDATFRKSASVATPLERKEIKYFLSPQYPESNQYEHYLQCFFGSGQPQDGVTHTFEASPPYCHQEIEDFSHLLRRIQGTLPDPHVVVCVRHPVARAYSHYIHNLHAFGLHGDGVYGGRHVLPSKIFKKSFQQSLNGKPRIMTHYYEYLREVYEMFGKDGVSLFFLESDTANFSRWVASLTGQHVVDELGLGSEPPKMVIPRRPVPNYAVKDEVLFAFGSRAGELVRYAGLPHPQRRAILDSRKHWTLDLGEDDMRRLVHEHFADDLERCTALTGDERFASYLTVCPEKQTAALTHGSILNTMHHGGDDAAG